MNTDRLARYVSSASVPLATTPSRFLRRAPSDSSRSQAARPASAASGRPDQRKTSDGRRPSASHDVGGHPLVDEPVPP